MDVYADCVDRPIRARLYRLALLAILLVSILVAFLAWNRKPPDQFRFLGGRFPVKVGLDVSSEVHEMRIYQWSAKYWTPMKEAEQEMTSLGAEVKHTPKDVGRWWVLPDGRTVMIGPGKINRLDQMVNAANVTASFGFIHVCVFEDRPATLADRALAWLRSCFWRERVGP